MPLNGDPKARFLDYIHTNDIEHIGGNGYLLHKARIDTRSLMSRTTLAL